MRPPLPVVLAVAVLGGLGCRPQAAADWSTELGAANEALAVRDSLAYRDAARRAAEALPAGELNRPFVMYHLARAEAWTGNPEAALEWLRVIWDERIESLMISYVAVDSLFAPYRSRPGFRNLMEEMSTVPITVEPMGGTVYLLVGAGSNVLASIGPDGVLLVDTGYAPAARALQAALSAQGGDAVRYVINTHVHEDHVGGNGTFGRGATVVAHARAAEAMAGPLEFIPGAVIPGRRGEALPDIGIEEPWSVTFNGETIEVVPLPAHSDGDLIVYFPGSHVVHLGDNFFPQSGRGMIFPGADLDAFRETMEALLGRLAPDTRVVSGHDPVTSVAVLREQYGRTMAAIGLVEDGVARGMTVDSITAAGAAEGFPETWLRYFDRLLRGS